MYAILFLSLVLLGGATLACYGGGHIDRRTIPALDPEMLLGRWYEVARFDNRFERGLTHVEALYTRNEDGSIRVENRGLNTRTGREEVKIGRAKFTDDPGRLRVSFFWIFYSDYNILERDAQGEWMLVGSHSPRFLWILARKPQLSPSEMDHILKLARLRGYDTSHFIYG